MFKLTLLACLLAPLICRANAGEFHTSESGDLFYVELEFEVTWYDALHECSIRNMTLLTPDTETKQLDISKLISSLDMRHYWTAGLEIQNLQFMWITTGDNVTYSNWEEGEPYPEPNDSEQQCIVTHRSDWGSYSCSLLMNFICEENPIVKEKKRELDALKANQSRRNNQLNESTKKLESDKGIITKLDVLWESYEKQRENLLDEKQREINDLKKENEQYLNQLSLAKAQLELKTMVIEMVKEFNELKFQLLEEKYNFTQDQKVSCNCKQT